MSVVQGNQSALASLSGQVQGTVSNNVSTEAAFTPRLQLIHGLSGVRTQWNKDSGPKPDEGNFCVGPPGFFFMGQKFFCVPLAQRDHALETKDDNVLLESFNAPGVGQMPANDAESVFLQIKSKMGTKEKGIQRRVGKDVLLWVTPQAQADPRWPGLTGSGKFAVYYLAGTAVPEAENFKRNFNRKVLVRSHQITTSFTWYVPEVDLHEDGSLDPSELPDLNIARDELTKFMNPVAKGDNMPKQTAEGVDGRAR